MTSVPLICGTNRKNTRQVMLVLCWLHSNRYLSSLLEFLWKWKKLILLLYYLLLHANLFVEFNVNINWESISQDVNWFTNHYSGMFVIFSTHHSQLSIYHWYQHCQESHHLTTQLFRNLPDHCVPVWQLSQGDQRGTRWYQTLRWDHPSPYYHPCAPEQLWLHHKWWPAS